MDFHRLDPDRESGRLREFLYQADPTDYLLEGLADWSREGRLWVGEEQGEWIAFGRLHDLGGGEGWLSGIRVVPARQGQGVGRLLLSRILSDARTIGVTTLRAVIEDGNTASRRLIARAGFSSVATLALRRGLAQDGPEPPLHRAEAQEPLDGPVEWVAGATGRVDLLPGTEGGRFGLWRPSLLDRWTSEGKLYVGPGLAAAVQVDWWREPRTLWVNPLRGDPARLIPSLGRLTQSLQHEEWQAFLPSTEPLRAEYASFGLRRHPTWGDRVQLYEQGAPTKGRDHA